MACVAGMEVEQHFKEILLRVGRWKIDGQSLDLPDFGNRQLPHFEASREEPGTTLRTTIEPCVAVSVRIQRICSCVS